MFHHLLHGYMILFELNFVVEVSSICVIMMKTVLKTRRSASFSFVILLCHRHHMTWIFIRWRMTYMTKKNKTKSIKAILVAKEPFYLQFSHSLKRKRIASNILVLIVLLDHKKMGDAELLYYFFLLFVTNVTKKDSCMKKKKLMKSMCIVEVL